VNRIALASALALLLAFGTTRPARADPPDGTRSEAAERFDRAIRLVNAGDLSSSLAEFQRAYTLVPAPIVLYNVGLVYAALNRPVDAVRELQKALSNQEALKPEHVERARTVVREQSDRIGQVEIATNVKEGMVEIDNVEAAKLPLAAPLDVAIGSHVIGVIAAGYAPARREVLVAGRAQAQTHLEVVLVAIEGLLAHIALRCRVPGADVFIDGERVGKTPLEASVTTTPGTHRIDVRRPGYMPAAHEITLGDGARGELSLDPTVDPSALGREGGWLAIRTSETQSVLTVDGEEIGLLKGPVQLPAGPHRLHVERGGFLPGERDVDVPLGGTRNVAMAFEPTPETRAQFVSGAQSRRTWGWVTLGVGAAVAAGGVAVALVAQSQLPGARDTLSAAEADIQPGGGGSCDPRGLVPDPNACKAKVNDAAAKVDNLGTTRTVGWVAAGLGGAVIATGAALLLTGDNPHKYDERPTDRLFGGWRVVPQIGLGGVFVSAAAQF
jgi:hypothetical protein